MKLPNADIKLHLGAPVSDPAQTEKKQKHAGPEAGAPQTATVEIAGLDIYDPIKDEVKSRDVHDIAYWMVDDDYDGSNFVVRQVFFCGGDKDEFDEWKRGPERHRQSRHQKEGRADLESGN